MQFYDLNARLNFGKYAGKTVEEVITSDPEYLEWCCLNLNHFYLEENARYAGDWSLSEAACSALEKNLEDYNQSIPDFEPIGQMDETYWSQQELEMADWDSGEYDYHNPAHHPDENPWIDVFGPDDEAEVAYWNTH